MTNVEKPNLCCERCGSPLPLPTPNGHFTHACDPYELARKITADFAHAEMEAIERER